MDERIGIIGGHPPRTTLAGLPLPTPPYPITCQLDDAHYVVLDVHPVLDVESQLAQLRAGLVVDEFTLPEESEVIDD